MREQCCRESGVAERLCRRRSRRGRPPAAARTYRARALPPADFRRANYTSSSPPGKKRLCARVPPLPSLHSRQDHLCAAARAAQRSVSESCISRIDPRGGTSALAILNRHAAHTRAFSRRSPSQELAPPGNAGASLGSKRWGNQAGDDHGRREGSCASPAARAQPARGERDNEAARKG